MYSIYLQKKLAVSDEFSVQIHDDRESVPRDSSFSDITVSHLISSHVAEIYNLKD